MTFGSGADLEYRSLLSRAGIAPANSAGHDGPLLEQLAKTREISLDPGGGGGGDGVTFIDFKAIGIYFAEGEGFDPTGATDSAPAFQALIDELRAISAITGPEGGTIVVPPGYFKLLTGLSTDCPNIVIMGLGARGENGNVGRGTSQLHYTGNGTAFTYNPGAPSTVYRGPEFRNIVIRGSAAGAVGIKLLRVNNFVLDHVAICDFTTGTAFISDGTGNINQYGILINILISNCKNGIEDRLGNGLRLVGGHLQGVSTPAPAGSFGIKKWDGGDTLKASLTNVQAFDICWDLQTGLGNELNNVRVEDWVTAAVKLAGVDNAVSGGSFNNTLNGGVGIGIWVTAGATGAKVSPTHIYAATRIQDDTNAASMPFEDTGWITPTVLAPWTNDATNPLRYRKIGNRVQFKGKVTGGDAWSTIAALPVGIKPPFTAGQFLALPVMAGAGGTTYNGAIAYIFDSGALAMGEHYVVAAGAGGYAIFDNLTYLV